MFLHVPTAKFSALLGPGELVHALARARRVPQCGTWDRLAQVCGQYLGKGQQVAIEGRLQTRQWDDDRGRPQW
ncbi:MAG: single-stranded DNA-binding protein [Candidatus Limnocylindrales bacterium]